MSSYPLLSRERVVLMPATSPTIFFAVLFTVRRELKAVYAMLNSVRAQRPNKKNPTHERWGSTCTISPLTSVLQSSALGRPSSCRDCSCLLSRTMAACVCNPRSSSSLGPALKLVDQARWASVTGGSTPLERIRKCSPSRCMTMAWSSGG